MQYEVEIEKKFLNKERVESILKTYFLLRYTASDMHAHLFFYITEVFIGSNLVLMDSACTSPDKPSVSLMYPIEYMTDLLLYKISKKIGNNTFISFKSQENGLLVSFSLE